MITAKSILPKSLWNLPLWVNHYGCPSIILQKHFQSDTIIKPIRGKKRRLESATNPIILRKIWPKIYPIQINILNENKEPNPEKTNPIWTFDHWLSFIVETMNKLMIFENAGIMNTLVYNIPLVRNRYSKCYNVSLLFFSDFLSNFKK